MGPSASTVTVGATFVTITSNVSNDSSPAASLKSRWIVTVPSSGTVKLNVGSVPTCTVVIALVNDQSNVYGIGPEALALAVTGVPSPTVSGPSGFMAAGIVWIEASNTRRRSRRRTASGADLRRREVAPRRRRWGAGENQDNRMRGGTCAGGERAAWFPCRSESVLPTAWAVRPRAGNSQQSLLSRVASGAVKHSAATYLVNWTEVASDLQGFRMLAGRGSPALIRAKQADYDG